MIQTFSTLELWCLLYLVQEFKEFIIYDKKYSNSHVLKGMSENWIIERKIEFYHSVHIAWRFGLSSGSKKCMLPCANNLL